MSIENLTVFERSAVMVGIMKLVNGRHFSICDFEEMAKMLGVEIPKRDQSALRIMHCVNYADMGPEIAQQTKARAIELLGLKPDDIEITPETKPAEIVRPRLSFWSRK